MYSFCNYKENRTMVFGLFKNINLVGTVDLLVEGKISHLKLEFSSFHAPPKLATCFRS